MMTGIGLLAMVIGVVITLLVLLGLVILVVWVVRRTNSGSPGLVNGTARAQSPKEVLQMRYARGEITREQYEQMVQDLNQ